MDGFISHLCQGGLCDTGTIDPVDVVVEQLMTGEASVWAPGVWEGLGCGSADRDQPPGAARCLLAGQGMAMYRCAVLTALAARYLLAPGLVTAGILGCGRAAQVQLMIIARHVPNVSHVAVRVNGEEALDQAVVDELDLAGIAMSVTRANSEAVFGASLIVVTDIGDIQLSSMHLAKGSVLVNATGRDLPEVLTGQVGQVFVDDLALLGQAARRGYAGPARVAARAQRRDQLAGDLRQVITGEHPGRRSQENVLLVELLSVGPDLDGGGPR